MKLYTKDFQLNTQHTNNRINRENNGQITHYRFKEKLD